MGHGANYFNSSGSENAMFGFRASATMSSGSRNTAIGAYTTEGASSGNDNTVVGYRATHANNNACVVLGRAATATASNQFVVGSSSYNAGTVVTASQTQTRYWEVVINGVTERILLA